MASCALVQSHSLLVETRSAFVDAHPALVSVHPAPIDTHSPHFDGYIPLTKVQAWPTEEDLTSDDGSLASKDGLLAVIFGELAGVDDQSLADDDRIEFVEAPPTSSDRHPALADNQPRFWNLAPAAIGTAWWDQGFQLHAQPFLRIRTRSISTIEGINRAMLEFAIPSQSVDRIELWLEGRDSTEPMINVLGYTGDGLVSADDAERIGEIITTIQTPHLGVEVIDVTDFVASRSSRGATHVGFRLQLANEAMLSIGLNIRAEWRTDARLVIYPTCYADCDSSSGSMVLDMFDFLCFQASFVATSSYACACDTSTGSGVCDLFDFLCFQQAYLEGCSR